MENSIDDYIYTIVKVNFRVYHFKTVSEYLDGGIIYAEDRGDCWVTMARETIDSHALDFYTGNKKSSGYRIRTFTFSEFCSFSDPTHDFWGDLSKGNLVFYGDEHYFNSKIYTTIISKPALHERAKLEYEKYINTTPKRYLENGIHLDIVRNIEEINGLRVIN